MFLAQMVLGGPGLLAGAAGGAALCAAAATSVYAMRKKIPHPTEFAFIGCCFLRGGCHKHPTFILVVEAHEAKNVPQGSDVYVYLECGRFEAKSQMCPVEAKMEVPIFEILKITVRQMDNFLKIFFYRKGTIKSTLMGEISLRILEDIIQEDYPQCKWYTMKKDEKSTVKICLSFHRMESNVDDNDSPLVRQAIINATRQAASRGQKFEKSYDDMTDQEKLLFLSGVLEGPLKMMRFKGWITYYFKAVEKRGRWSWNYWHSEDDMQKNAEPIGKIPLLSISLVLPDSHQRQQLYVKYHTKEGPQDLFLRRVDRDRDIWSNGLYEFIERLRDYIEEQKYTVKKPKVIKDDKPKPAIEENKDTEETPEVKPETTNHPVNDMVQSTKNASRKTPNDFSLVAANSKTSLQQIFEGPL